MASGAQSEHYVNPLIANDEGDGSVGLPFGDLQYALETITRDATNGDRINIKNGTDEILAAVLSLTTYIDGDVTGNVPGANVPLIFQGYSVAAGDGGEGGIDCNGNAVFTDANIDGVYIVDMHIHNSTATPALLLDNSIFIIRCRFDNCTNGAVLIGSLCLISQCYFTNCSGTYIVWVAGINSVIGCFFEDAGTNEFGAQVLKQTGTNASNFINNIIKLRSGSTSDCFVWKGVKTAFNNIAYHAGGDGTGAGFVDSSATLTRWFEISGNYAEGFKGTGGRGFQNNSDTQILDEGENFSFNNETPFDIDNGWILRPGTQTALSSSGLVDPVNNDFSPKLQLLEAGAPKVVGVSTGTALTTFMDAGAIQQQCLGNTVSVGGDASNYFEDQLAEYTFRAGYDFQSANVYLALYTSNPDEDNTGTEVAASSYVRQSISFGSPSSGVTSNDATITFPTSTESWGTITHFAIFDAETSGNMLVYSTIYPETVVASSVQLTVDVGVVSITID